MVRHQETAAERSDDLYFVSNLEVAHIVRGHATNRFALVILKHALNGQRDVVVARALAVARASDGILARMMGATFSICPRRYDADRLAF